MVKRCLILTAFVGMAALSSGCARDNQLVVDQGVGITSTLSACPSTAIAQYTGDVTSFDPVDSRDAHAIDVEAYLTNLRSLCNETGERIYSSVSFDVNARRRDNRGARQVTLPYFSVVMRGGTAVESKRLGAVTLNFADGAYRATAKGEAAAYIDKQAATLPADIREKITRKRKPGDPDAALDPLADPEVRDALRRTGFELLVGFQLTNEQLEYNATR